MKGCRALTAGEVTWVGQVSQGTYAARDQSLFVLGDKTGFLISEVLSLIVGDVWPHGRFVDYVAVQRRHMKQKREGRSVIVHPDAKAALTAWLMEMQRTGTGSSETYLFPRTSFPRAKSSMACSALAKPGISRGKPTRVRSYEESVEPHDEKSVWAKRL